MKALALNKILSQEFEPVQELKQQTDAENILH